METNKNHQELVFSLFRVGITPFIPPRCETRSGFMQGVAPVNYFPEQVTSVSSFPDRAV